MNKHPLIHEYYKKFKPEFNGILAKIKQYDRIAIFRHIMPDFDALGTQLGLYTWIKDNFPNKEVKVFGDNHVTFTPRIYQEMDDVNENWFKEPFLTIILDVGNANRIADPRFNMGEFKIKIDHHPNTEKVADLNIMDTNAAAASEIVSAMLIEFKRKGYVLSETAASHLYSALVGDSGRFQFSSTSSLTFEVASGLLESGINISNIYQKMYLKKLEDLDIMAYILTHYSVSEHGVAYYVLDKDIQSKFNITTERGKENVNLFSNIDGVNAWCSITEDVKEPCWRVSIRSKAKDISGVAKLFEGGGHKQASGAKLNSLDDLDRFINELDKLFI